MASATVKRSKALLRRRQFDLAPLQHLLVGLQPPAIGELHSSSWTLKLVTPCFHLNSHRAMDRTPHSGTSTSETRKRLETSFIFPSCFSSKTTVQHYQLQLTSTTCPATTDTGCRPKVGIGISRCRAGTTTRLAASRRGIACRVWAAAWATPSPLSMAVNA